MTEEYPTENLNYINQRILFKIRRSMLYHRACARKSMISGLLLIFICASIACSYGYQYIWKDFGLDDISTLVSISFLPSTVMGILLIRDSQKIFRFSGLYKTLEQKFMDDEGVPRNLSTPEVSKVVLIQLEILKEVSEDYQMVRTLCHYDLLTKMGNNTAHHPKFPLWRKLLRHYTFQSSMKVDGDLQISINDQDYQVL